MLKIYFNFLICIKIKGQTVFPLKKSEINAIADLAGPLLLLKLCLIEFASTLTKLIKLELVLKT